MQHPLLEKQNQTKLPLHEKQMLIPLHKKQNMISLHKKQNLIPLLEKQMHEQNTKHVPNHASEFIELGLNNPNHRYIPSNLVPLFNYIQFLCKYHGYCFITDKALAKKFNKSTGTINHNLKELQDCKIIVRERSKRKKLGGSRRLIWTMETFQHRSEYLNQFNPEEVIGVKQIAAYVDPNINKILSTSVSFSQPIFYGNNEPKIDPENNPNRKSNRKSLPSSHINIANLDKDEVVYKQSVGSRRQILPQNKKILVEHKSLSPDEELCLIRSYDESFVKARIRRYEKRRQENEKQGHTGGAWYAAPAYQIIKAMCETDWAKEVRIKDKCRKSKMQKSETKLEQVIEDRINELKNNTLINQYCSFKDNVFAIDLSQLSREQKLQLEIYALSVDPYDPSEYDAMLVRFIDQLKVLTHTPIPKIDNYNSISPKTNTNYLLFDNDERIKNWKKERDARRYGQVKICSAMAKNMVKSSYVERS